VCVLVCLFSGQFFSLPEINQKSQAQKKTGRHNVYGYGSWCRLSQRLQQSGVTARIQQNVMTTMIMYIYDDDAG
jgi:hypothetical protein